ncbi:hypothetical protein [Rubritalea marina]|uniref:hypothetical protein n=1 Tax=Rubritalea marina TaxID=361055 RepID=UPI00037DA4EE|nr:hypothetical protein [Rubritalea marina]
MIFQRKVHYPISSSLQQYLYHFGRVSEIPLIYQDLLRFVGSIPYDDPQGNETLWLTVMYPPQEQAVLDEQLISIYTALKIGGDTPVHEHLTVDRIDFGEFGNSRPFRIKITNQFNDNSDYFYVKLADASRLFGLELEHILSPNRMNYLVNGDTLIEDHIAGVPGDVFSEDYLNNPELNRVRISKEFSKFNERCFIRLLGDMRSVNYVVDITPDFEEVQYRVRPIDFDQQSYEGRAKVYHAYNFRSNRQITRLSFDALNRQTIKQYAEEERSQMARRATAEHRRLSAILRTMNRSQVCPEENVISLAQQLGGMHKTDRFDDCKTMGALTAEHIAHVLGIEDLKYH